MLIFVCCVVCLLYFLPIWTALAVGSKNKGEILAINLLLGWTAAGWVCALTLAMLWSHQDERSLIHRRGKR